MTYPEQQQPGHFVPTERTQRPAQRSAEHRMVEQRLVEQRLVERCARAHHQTGLSLMAGRVLAYTMLDDARTHTAHGFSLGLGISSAAVSGAVRELERLGLLERSRASGVRAIQYAPRVAREDVWVRLLAAQTDRLRLAHEQALAYGTRALGQDHRMLRRLAQAGVPLARPDPPSTGRS